MQKNLSDLVGDLKSPKRIVITTHRNPDGDAMGSSLGLYDVLTAQGHDVLVITPTNYPSFLKWMPADNTVLKWSTPEHQEQITKRISEADYVFCLDFNDLSRIDELGELVAASTAKKVMIDHHPNPADFSDYQLHDTKACSTAELIYDFSMEHLRRTTLSKEAASCLYAGIVTDSGSFRFPSTTSKVHFITAKLLEAGADNAAIYEAIFDSNKENRLRIMGHCFSQRLKFIEDGKVALMWLNLKDMKDLEVGAGDTEGLVNYPLSVLGVRVSILACEYPDIVKISFRSKGDFPANKLANEHFHGGGHKNAAGGRGEGTAEETIQKIENALQQYKEYL